jgi:hypothetical protein
LSFTFLCFFCVVNNSRPPSRNNKPAASSLHRDSYIKIPNTDAFDTNAIIIYLRIAPSRPRSRHLLPTAKTASTLAPYRASAIDHAHPASREPARDLPSFKMANTYEEGRQSLPTMDPISRPSSTSTQNSTLHHSASLPHLPGLPGLSALASLASTNNSPQLRYVGTWTRCGRYLGWF